MGKLVSSAAAIIATTCCSPMIIPQAEAIHKICGDYVSACNC